MSYIGIQAANETYLGTNKTIFSANPNLKPVDWVLMLCALALIGFGLVMIYSATLGMSGIYGGFYYLQRQLIALAISMMAMIVVIQLPRPTLIIISRYAILLAIILLCLVLVPGVGRGSKGAIRWLGFAGFNFQPAELTKLAIILYVGDYIARKPDAIRGNIIKQLPIIAIILLVSFLLIRQPDHGSIMIIWLVVFTMLFLGGMRYWVVALLTIGGTSLVWIYVKWFAPAYAINRLFTFINPLKDANGDGYQLSHSLFAYSRGQFSGVGLGESIEKMRYLPEIHNDFILALIGEETGFVGVLTVLLIFCLFLLRGFFIGKTAVYRNDLFGALVVYGICLWIGLQALMNAAVTMALVPTKGITLPFVSYGSSSLIVLGVALGVIINIQRQKEVLNIITKN